MTTWAGTPKSDASLAKLLDVINETVLVPDHGFLHPAVAAVQYVGRHIDNIDPDDHHPEDNPDTTDYLEWAAAHLHNLAAAALLAAAKLRTIKESP